MRRHHVGSIRQTYTTFDAFNHNKFTLLSIQRPFDNSEMYKDYVIRNTRSWKKRLSLHPHNPLLPIKNSQWRAPFISALLFVMSRGSQKSRFATFSLKKGEASILVKMNYLLFEASPGQREDCQRCLSTLSCFLVTMSCLMSLRDVAS